MVRTPKKRQKTKSKSTPLSTPTAVKDEISLQLEEERKQALVIINSMLGSTAGDGNGVKEMSPPVAENECSEDAQLHIVELEDEEKDRNEEMDSYSVNTDLKMLFNSTAEDGNHAFSFLGGTLEEKGNSSDSDPQTSHATEDLMDTTQAVISRLSRVDDNKEMDQSVSDAPRCFFFHSDNEGLRNRLYEENSFHSSESLEDLEWEWPERRAVMKEGFRRRHKDAVKLARKKRRYIPSTGPVSNDATKISG